MLLFQKTIKIAFPSPKVEYSPSFIESSKQIYIIQPSNQRSKVPFTTISLMFNSKANLNQFNNFVNPFAINIPEQPQPPVEMEEEEDVKIRPVSFNKPSGMNSMQTGWKDLMMRSQLLRIIKETGFQYPSEVQKQGIVQILKGCNLICQAKSGTGKTAVFVLSILQLMYPHEGTAYLPHQCLIMVPTRQLAHQILKEFLHFSKYIEPKIPISAFFGGVPIESNVTELCNESTSPAIIISTPGRLNDLYQRNYIILCNCKYFILDECDKILENPKMKADFWSLYQKATSKKQSLMFSATISSQSLFQMREMMGSPPAEVKIEEDKSILNGLTQFFLRITQLDKFDKLQHLLDTLTFNQCIIFVNRIDKTRKLVDLLRQKLYNPISIHSSLRQEERIINYDLFKKNSTKILVATDVFGRGIDIQKVNLVINYDFPRDCETYLHRVGRAGRFGAKGIAINFIRIDDNEGKNGPQNDDDLVREIKVKYRVQLKELPYKINITDYL